MVSKKTKSKQIRKVSVKQVGPSKKQLSPKVSVKKTTSKSSSKTKKPSEPVILKQSKYYVGAFFKIIARNSVAASFVIAAVLTFAGTGLAVMLRSHKAESELSQTFVPVTGDAESSVRASEPSNVETPSTPDSTAETPAEPSSDEARTQVSQTTITGGRQVANTTKSNSGQSATQTETIVKPSPAASEGLAIILEEIPFSNVSINDTNLPEGQVKVVQKGSNGLTETTYTVYYTDGVETSRAFASTRIIRNPIDQVTHIGVAPISAPEDPEVSPVTPEDNTGLEDTTVSNSD